MTGAASQAAKLFSDVEHALAASDIADIDYVLCAGDITNRADAPALERAWGMVASLASNLGARLIATAGNHDYASHSRDDPPDLTADLPAEVDPKDALLQLDPQGPGKVASAFSTS